jgi:hypothetical protein
MAPVHHYAIWFTGVLVPSRGEAGRSRAPAPMEVRRHTFAEAQAEASRVLSVLRDRGYEAQEGLGLWQSFVSRGVPGQQFGPAGPGELARVRIDDIGIVACDGRCQAEIEVGTEQE